MTDDEAITLATLHGARIQRMDTGGYYTSGMDPTHNVVEMFHANRHLRAAGVGAWGGWATAAEAAHAWCEFYKLDAHSRGDITHGADID